MPKKRQVPYFAHKAAQTHAQIWSARVLQLEQSSRDTPVPILVRSPFFLAHSRRVESIE